MSLSNADPEAPFRPGAAAPWPSWAGRLRGRPALRAAGVLFTAGVAGWVIHQITEAGWRQVADSLPATPWFYLIFAGMYLVPPLSEVFVFRRLWGPVPGLWPAMLMRRLYSGHLIDYSGEAWLYVWARRRQDLPHRRIVHGIKDNVILSSAVSTLFAAAVLGILAAGGWLVLDAGPLAGHWGWLLAAPVVLGAMFAAARAMRRRLLSAPPPVAAAVGAAHLLRQAAVHVLQVALWVVVEPAVPLTSWLTLLAAQIVLTRVPFLPGRDLLFVGAGLGLSGYLSIESATVASILLTTAVLDRGLNLVLYLLCRWWRPLLSAARPRPSPRAAPRAQQAGEAGPGLRCRSVEPERDLAPSP